MKTVCCSYLGHDPVHSAMFYHIWGSNGWDTSCRAGIGRIVWPEDGGQFPVVLLSKNNGIAKLQWLGGEDLAGFAAVEQLGVYLHATHGV